MRAKKRNLPRGNMSEFVISTYILNRDIQYVCKSDTSLNKRNGEKCMKTFTPNFALKDSLDSKKNLNNTFLASI